MSPSAPDETVHLLNEGVRTAVGGAHALICTMLFIIPGPLQWPGALTKRPTPPRVIIILSDSWLHIVDFQHSNLCHFIKVPCKKYYSPLEITQSEILRPLMRCVCVLSGAPLV